MDLIHQWCKNDCRNSEKSIKLFGALLHLYYVAVLFNLIFKISGFGLLGTGLTILTLASDLIWPCQLKLKRRIKACQCLSPLWGYKYPDFVLLDFRFIKIFESFLLLKRSAPLPVADWETQVDLGESFSSKYFFHLLFHIWRIFIKIVLILILSRPLFSVLLEFPTLPGVYLQLYLYVKI